MVGGGGYPGTQACCLGYHIAGFQPWEAQRMDLVDDMDWPTGWAGAPVSNWGAAAHRASVRWRRRE